MVNGVFKLRGWGWGDRMRKGTEDQKSTVYIRNYKSIISIFIQEKGEVMKDLLEGQTRTPNYNRSP